MPDGKEAKNRHYGFVKETFRDLKNGAKRRKPCCASWSEITREDRQFVEAEKRCIYCTSEIDLHREYIAPKSALLCV